MHNNNHHSYTIYGLHRRKTGPAIRPRLIALAVAAAWAAQSPAMAQQAAADEPQKVVVTGMRAAMQSTLNLKRNSDGIVDGIVADDIGKFPDTNLAESLQRISGVSIDRNQGEGAQMTVRGVGPDLNMVLLNGRQMPTSSLRDQNGRAFDFANLASESISQIQVYKSSRADSPPGGVGATVNIMTARPFDNPNGVASLGIKAVYDTSHDNLPARSQSGSALTPEVSGLYSKVFGNGMFGIGIAASVQERRSGENRAAINNGWRGPFRGDENNWGAIAQPSNPGSSTFLNRPDASDLYSVPQNVSYTLRGTERKRVNGQLVLQFKPTSDIVTTLDYTYSQNKIHTRYSELTAWFNFGPSNSRWTDGPLATPTFYEEQVSNQDMVVNGSKFGTTSENGSLGFNAAWKVNPGLKLTFDAHRSIAESTPASPWGSSNTLATASFSRGNSGVDLTHEMPVMTIQGVDFARAPIQATGSWFRHGEQKMEIDQLQLSGRQSLFDSSGLNFGVGVMEMKNRSVFQSVQRDTWTGASKAADYPASMFQHEDLSQYFNKLGGHDAPGLFNNLWTFDFEEVRQRASDATGQPATFLPSLSNPEYDRRTTEKNKSVYLQFNTDWATAMPIHTGFGVRVEQTRVISSALSPTAVGMSWVSENEFPVAFGSRNLTTLVGKYTNVLPSVDWDMDVRSDLKVRASYGVTIGRPRFDQIEGGQSMAATANVAGLNGARGNPALKPVKSKNLDLSAEWYYAKQSVASVGLFYKDLSNYAGQGVQDETLPTLHTPVGGRYWNGALASGCLPAERRCIRQFIFENYNGQPGVARTSKNVNGEWLGTITAQASDPLSPFKVTSYVNEKTANLQGAEFNVQHMFGASGFGLTANYTYVKSNLAYDVMASGNQFALVGLSDSANLIGIYEDDKWAIRAAYNWRDKFLRSVTDASGPNPEYVEPYGQLDVSVGYSVNKNLSLQLEAINLLDDTVRVHGRTKMMVLEAIQGGPRYMVSARYKF